MANDMVMAREGPTVAFENQLYKLTLSQGAAPRAKMRGYHFFLRHSVFREAVSGGEGAEK